MSDENVTLIYLLSEMDGTPVYVGKTHQKLSDRIRQHRNCGNKTRISRWAKNRGFNILVSILEEVSDHNWSDRESFWIEKYLSQGFSLLNILKGGQGAHRRARFSEEHRAKIGAALRTGREKPCEWCGACFWARPAKERKGFDRFCGTLCANQFKGSRRKGTSSPVVWSAVEAAAALRKARTHCIRGHEFNEENTRVRANGGRVCRACMRMHVRNFKLKKASAQGLDAREATALKLRIDGSVNGV